MADHWEYKTLVLVPVGINLTVSTDDGQKPKYTELTQCLNDLANDEWEIHTVIPGNQYPNPSTFHPTLILRKLRPKQHNNRPVRGD